MTASMPDKGSAGTVAFSIAWCLVVAGLKLGWTGGIRRIRPMGSLWQRRDDE